MAGQDLMGDTFRAPFSQNARSRTIPMMMSPAPGPAPARSALAEAIVAFRLPDELIRKHIHEIHQGVLAHSRYIREASFTSIHRGDLEFLFGAYDERFFTGLCLRALEGRSIRFRLAMRMTNAGGNKPAQPHDFLKHLHARPDSR